MRKLDVALLVAWILGAREVSAQCQSQKIVASDFGAGDQFGSSISASGDWLIVGVPEDADLAPAAGSAYVYHRQGANWVETQKLYASDGALGDEFGYAVGISGDIAVITARGESPMGIFGAGSAYLFERSGSTWIETAKLFANDATPEDHFGQAVAISGNRIVFGVSHDDPVGSGSGSIYVFEKSGNLWSQFMRLTPSGLAPGDAFGFSVAIDGDTIVVGSLGDEGPAGQNNTGSAYVFDRDPGLWVQRQKLIPSDPAMNQSFGVAVSVSGTMALIGAAHDSTAGSIAGSVYAFEKQGSTWTQIQEIKASDSNPQNQFGSFLAHAGNTAIIGALSDSDSAFACGSAYEFRRVGSTWIQAGKMLAADGTQGGLLGRSVALTGNAAIAGAPVTDDACPTDPNCESGSVYVFELAPTAVQYGSCKLTSACGNVDDHGGCDNSTGQGAVLAACGSGSVSTDDLRLEVTRCPPNKLTLLFMGPAQSQVIYGNGVRVAGPQNPTIIYRYGGAQSDAQGRVIRGPGLVAQSQGFPPLGRIQSGQSWNFQTWYRDPNGWCGANTNFSNGVQVGFGP